MPKRVCLFGFLFSDLCEVSCNKLLVYTTSDYNSTSKICYLQKQLTCTVQFICAIISAIGSEKCSLALLEVISNRFDVGDIVNICLIVKKTDVFVCKSFSTWLLHLLVFQFFSSFVCKCRFGFREYDCLIAIGGFK